MKRISARVTSAALWTSCTLSLALAPAAALAAEPAAAPPRMTVTPVQHRTAGRASEAAPPARHEVRDLVEGTSSLAVRKAAISALPLDRLSPAHRQQAQSVLESLSLFRRMPTLVFEVDPELYVFFTKNPDVAVSIWRVMEISKFALEERSPDRYFVDAGDGSTGTIEVLHRGAEDTLILCSGDYKSPLLVKSINASALIHLQTSFFREADGSVYATHRAQLFVAFPSHTVEAAARLISPVSNMIADRNFKQITLFVNMMSLAMARQPGWIESIANRLDGVTEEQRSEFLKLAAQIYVAARKRELASTSPREEITLEEIMRPLKGEQTSGIERASGSATPAGSVINASGETSRLR